MDDDINQLMQKRDLDEDTARRVKELMDGGMSEDAAVELVQEEDRS